MSDFKTISEVADQLQLPQHVLRFWESQFSQIKPAKRRGGRRFYSAHDLEVIQKIQNLLYVKGYTIKGAKKALNQNFMPSQMPNMSPPTPNSDKKQADLFGLIETPALTARALPAAKTQDKEGLKKILAQLKDAEKLLQQD